MKSTQLVAPFVAALFATYSLAAQESEISTDRATYLPGEPIIVRFKNSPGNLLDWTGLYKEGAADGAFVIWQYLDGSLTGVAAQTSGQTVFPKGITTPGNHEVRLYLDDGYTRLAENTFVVAASPRVLLSPGVVVPGSAVSVTFTNAPGNAKDWIGIFKAGAANTSPVDRLYLDGTTTGTTVKRSGTLTFTLSAGGKFEARLFANDSTEPLDRAAFAVEYPRPAITVAPGDSVVNLSWPAVRWPIPVEKYIVLAGDTPGGAANALAELTPNPGENTFRHTGQVNGREACYRVRALGAGGQAISESAPICTAPYALESGQHVAFDALPGTRGTQAWPGALGMEFELVNGISVSRLGVFDDGSDGLKRTITARLFDLAKRQALATLEFTPSSPGVLIGGSRFKPLPSPLALAAGFKGVIVAEGYGADEAAGNASLGAATWKKNDGIGSLLFVGKGRFGRAGAYPGTADVGPANRYAAGTFEYRVTEVRAPGKPAVLAVPDDGAVSLSWPAVTAPLPAARYRIFRGSSEQGAYTQIAEITATEYRDTGRPNGQTFCYKVRAITEANVAGPESDPVCQVPDKPAAGIAYVNPPDTEGNQAFGGSVGNDFDVVRPVRITRLGTFDDSSDGLMRAIAVRVYDRVTLAEMAKLVFTPENPGELIGGSRFKDLPQPLVLPIGFQGAIVGSGYGSGERDGNNGIPGATRLDLDTFTGGCLKFVGLSRWGDDPDAYPQIIDTGPANRYAAGTFSFEPYNPPAEARLTISIVSGKITIAWTGSGALESSPVVTGAAWQSVAGAVSGMQIAPSGQATFYRLRQ